MDKKRVGVIVGSGMGGLTVFQVWVGGWVRVEVWVMRAHARTRVRVCVGWVGGMWVGVWRRGLCVMQRWVDGWVGVGVNVGSGVAGLTVFWVDGWMCVCWCVGVLVGGRVGAWRQPLPCVLQRSVGG